ncbi:hypothetical protein D8B23_21820 [Verminephrobacter aporrectodeae subsp. tuberculatae]|nr:hypothetical protein [Verminephrobacter aporrectodeae subsp. tuberculatae]
MLWFEAIQPKTRIIYIGESFIADVLVHGKFPSDSAIGPADIPAWGAWTDMSRKITPDPKHMSHWHLSLSDQP